MKEKSRKLLLEDLERLREEMRALKGSQPSEAPVPHYRTLIEQIPAITYVAALDGGSNTLFVSPQIETLIGFSPSDYLENPGIWRERLHPDDRDRVLAEVARSHSSGKPFDSEYRMVARDGRVVCFHDSARIVCDDRGQPLFLQGVMYDITSHKKIEDALEKSECLYRVLFESSADGILVAKRDTARFTFANPAICRMLGYTEKELLRMGVRDIHPEDKLDHVLSIFSSQAKGDTTLAENIPFMKRDGTIFWGNVNSAPVTLDGEACVLGLIRDITEKKESEEAVRESEEKLKTITSSAHDAIVMMDDRGNISYWNRAAEKIFGYSRREVMGKDLHALLAPERYRADSRNGIETFLKTGRGPVVGKTLELAAVNKHGREFPIELSVSVVKVKGGWNAIGLVRDIRERKKAETAIRSSEEKFHTVFDNAKDSIFIETPEGKILDVNTAACSMLGYTKEELCSMDVSEIVAPQLAKSLPPVIKAETVSNGVYVESLEMRKDGKLIPVEVSNTLVEIGGRKRVIAIVRDITERKRAERKRTELQKRLENTLTKVLSGYIPICANCKSIRDSDGTWSSVEAYIKGHTEVEFTHGICSDCAKKLYPDIYP